MQYAAKFVIKLTKILVHLLLAKFNDFHLTRQMLLQFVVSMCNISLSTD